MYGVISIIRLNLQTTGQIMNYMYSLTENCKQW